MTPHAAFVSQESFAEAREICLRQQVQLLVEGRPPDHLVNAPAPLRPAGA
jgi:lactate dehydrogenase-like 2-hydroxyacid dehydrogenase